MINISNTNLLNKPLFYNFIHIDKEFFKQLYSSMKPPSIDSHIFPKSLTTLMVWICVMYCNYIIKWYSFHCSPTPVCELSALLSLGLGSTYPIVEHKRDSHISLLFSSVFDKLITAAITTARMTNIWIKYTTADLWQIWSIATLFWFAAKAQLQHYVYN